MSSSFKYLHKLQDKRVLIFGGSSGFGFAVAEAAIEHGAQVIISGSNQGKLNLAVSRLKEQYPDTSLDQVTSLACDLAKLESLDTRLEELLSKATNGGANKIDHIVYTADNTHRVPTVDKTTVEDVDLSLRLRAFSASILAKVAASTDYLSRSSGSSVTFTNGVSGHRPVKGWAIPAMAATALEGLVRGLAVDLAPIRVNLVSAGPVATDMLLSLPKDILDMYAEQTVLKALGTPEDIAEAYLYLMKDRYITGTILFSDGGRRIA
ncbi:hypothetical protein NM208_g8837 [Fusarium decemcellulare]|uniref:Uncharacterized protein n=1 Tax=Fusarium decemcellulare TaxID=57161 RepID=A0ACC1S3V6_9HYPO|nr:hypothetical protein NM208_g8837 [Fusarium decemcellulare]